MKRIAAVLMGLFAVCYASVYVLFTNVPVSQVFRQNTPAAENGGNPARPAREAATLNFVEQTFLGKNGEIRTRTVPSGLNDAVLSESVGLLMDYSVLRGRKDLFDLEFSYLKGNLMEMRGKGAARTADKTGREAYPFLAYIRWNSYGRTSTCNAAIDDLRIAGALLDAYDLWKEPVYFDTAGFILKGIHDSQTDDGRLCELYDWSKGEKQKSIPLCYLDLYNLTRASAFDKGWEVTAEKGLRTIKDGRIPGTPFFYKHYSYSTGRYALDEEVAKGGGICITYTLLTALHLAEVNEDTDFFISWLKDEMETGVLHAWYDPRTLKPSDSMESTAVYAIAALYAKKAGEEELSEKLLSRMQHFMVRDERSPFHGGFGDLAAFDYYSFDNLTALLALATADTAGSVD